MPGQYEAIKDWYNDIIDAADKAQSRMDASLLGDNTVLRVAAVNAVLTQALVDLWGGATLPDDTKAAVRAISEKMVEEGVTGFKRKGEGEELRKIKKAPDRFLRSIGLRTDPESPSDFFKHQYKAAKQSHSGAGRDSISPLSSDLDDASLASDSILSAISSDSDKSVHGGAGKRLGDLFARAGAGSDDELDFTSKSKSRSTASPVASGSVSRVSGRTGSDSDYESLASSSILNTVSSSGRSSASGASRSTASPVSSFTNSDLESPKSLITEVEAKRMPDWRDDLSPLNKRDKAAAASLGAIFAGKGKGHKYDFPENLPLPGIATSSHKKPGRKI